MRKAMYSIAILAGIFFIYLALNFDRPIWATFDQEIWALLKDNRLIIIFHYLGEPVVAGAVGILLILYFAFSGKDYRAMLVVVLIFAGGNGLNQLLKYSMQRPRPEMVNQLTTYSFPSGHTMAGFFTFISVAYFLTRGLGATKKSLITWLIAIIVVVLIGLSRIAEGRHFATDVLAGWSIGYTWFMMCVWWYERRKVAIKNG